MDKLPQDRDARLAFLQEWAKSEQDRLTEEQDRLAQERFRLAAEERMRRHAERRARAEGRYAEQIPRALAQARRRIGQVDSLREATAIPVVITKPSDHPVDRAAVFADLMVGLRGYEWADPIISEFDEPRYIAPRAIDLARRCRPGAPWLLYMEDDVILGPDFGLLPGLLREADEIFPYTGLVSFFSPGLVEPGWSIHPMEEFSWLQCAAIRNTDYLVDFRSAGEHLYEHPDVAVKSFLADEYEAYALWCPSLVQHAEVTSAFFGQSMDASERISKSYEQAYG